MGGRDEEDDFAGSAAPDSRFDPGGSRPRGPRRHRMRYPVTDADSPRPGRDVLARRAQSRGAPQSRRDAVPRGSADGAFDRGDGKRQRREGGSGRGLFFGCIDRLSVPRQQHLQAVERASADFGATAVAVGRVTRWREREGSAAGATQPASVAFEVSLYEAPSGRRLWTGRFDETQKSITEAILRARQYPGGGTRWLSTEEFARWGAKEVAKSILASP